MKAITKYIAYDGKEFDSQQACEEYEATCPLPKDVICYDGEGYVTQDPCNAYFIFVPNTLEEDATEIVRDWLNDNGLDETDGFNGAKGLFVWDWLAESYGRVDLDDFAALRRVMGSIEPNF